VTRLHDQRGKPKMHLFSL